MRYSIVIPTYNKFEETLKPCLISLLRSTTIGEDHAEIIVVANGCTDETESYVRNLSDIYPDIRLLSFPEPLGYTKAVNIGIKESKGRAIVLLNNDTQILGSKKDEWLEILHKPFTELGMRVGITGPMKQLSPEAGREFLIFFCVMIDKELFKEIGLLDEVFSPGYGEDTDFCCRAEDAGWAIVQVPDDNRPFYGDKKRTGSFPIYHEGNVTFKNWEGGEELLRRNNEILRERYNKEKSTCALPIRMLKCGHEYAGSEVQDRILCPVCGKVDNIDSDSFAIKDIVCPDIFNTNEAELVDISTALTCDGYMSDVELTWLAKEAKKAKVFIEVGSWHGRSSRAIADNLPKDGKLYCVDHWLGSKFERDTNHASAELEGGDHAFIEFCNNLADHIMSGRVVPIRMTSVNAANWFKKYYMKADVIFIDAGHTYEEVKEDIEAWEPLVKEGGIICGHDYYHDGEVWPGVQQAVDERYGHKGTDMGYIPGNSIWRHTMAHSIDGSRPKIYDCFPFNNELEILDKRFEELYDVVDRFVIVEASKSHSGNPKPYHFRENLDRYGKYLNKVTHIMIDDYPEVPENATITDRSWAIERHQRDAIMRGLTQCNNHDTIIISDVDEIPNKAAIHTYHKEKGITCLEMDLYYYDEYTKAKDKWKEAKILTYKDLKRLGTPCSARYYGCESIIRNAGKHMSYFGGVDRILQKIEDTAHQEYNTPEYKDRQRIQDAIKNGRDVFGRANIEFEKV